MQFRWGCGVAAAVVGLYVLHRRRRSQVERERAKCAAQPSVEALDSPRMSHVVESEPLSSWEYKAEGNINVVLTYLGSHPLLVGRILRLAKCKSAPPSPAAAPAITTTDPLTFAHSTILPMIGKEYVTPGSRVTVSSTFLESIQCLLNESPTRPSHRQGRVDTLKGHVILMWDRTMLVDPASGVSQALSPSFCVELKPKWGLLPQPGAPPTDVRARVCRFCMHQVLKVSEGKEATVSHYCPIDLFSRTPDGVGRALNSLVATPQNNLRVFEDGRRLFNATSAPDGDPATQRRTLNSLLLPSVFGSAHDSDPSLPFLKLLQGILCVDPVLDVVRSGQSLDTEGIAVVKERFDRLVSEMGSVERVVDLLQDREATRLDIQAIQRFLVAATIKDSSLLVAFKLIAVTDDFSPDSLPAHVKFAPLVDIVDGNIAERLSPSPPRSKESVTVGVLHSEAVVDIDPKDPLRIPRYHTLDHKILKVFEAQPAPDRKRSCCV